MDSRVGNRERWTGEVDEKGYCLEGGEYVLGPHGHKLKVSSKTGIAWEQHSRGYEYQKNRVPGSVESDGLTCQPQGVLEREKYTVRHPIAKGSSPNLLVCVSCGREEDHEQRVPRASSDDFYPCPSCGGAVTVKCGSGERRCKSARKNGFHRCGRHKGRPKETPASTATSGEIVQLGDGAPRNNYLGVKAINSKIAPHMRDITQETLEGAVDPLSNGEEIVAGKALLRSMLCEDDVNTEQWAKVATTVLKARSQELDLRIAKESLIDVADVVALIKMVAHRLSIAVGRIDADVEKAFEDADLSDAASRDRVLNLCKEIPRKSIKAVGDDILESTGLNQHGYIFSVPSQDSYDSFDEGVI